MQNDYTPLTLMLPTEAQHRHDRPSTRPGGLAMSMFFPVVLMSVFVVALLAFAHGYNPQ